MIALLSLAELCIYFICIYLNYKFPKHTEEPRQNTYHVLFKQANTLRVKSVKFDQNLRTATPTNKYKINFRLENKLPETNKGAFT